jgi:RNA recognition motif. (a.k.a. RRM, RBD, or RNP domain)
MQIFVGNLAFTTTEEELSQLFEPYGIVESARIITLALSTCRTPWRPMRRLLSLMGRRWGDEP